MPIHPTEHPHAENGPRLLLGPIIGGLTPTSVKLWARASAPATLYAWLKPATSSEARLVGQSPLVSENGFSGTIEVDSLEPLSSYDFALTLENKIPGPERFSTFRTAPRPGEPTSFQFAFGSCFRPSSKESAGQVFMRIREAHPDLSFLLLLGDQIYADDWKHNSLGHVAQTLEDYRAAYLHTWSNPSFRALLSRTPVYMTLDDHEVDNDWRWRDRQRTQAEIPLYTRILRLMAFRPMHENHLSTDRVKAALRAYWEHQGIHISQYIHTVPSSEEGFQFDPEAPGSFAYAFDHGVVSFFVLDARTQRVCNTRERQVLGEDQWKALEGWLLAVKDTSPVKFIVTSSALLNKFLGDIANDRWSSYPDQRDRLLRFILNHRIHGVYFLTGDLHSGHAISAMLKEPGTEAIPVWEFCSSPFEQDTNYLANILTLRNPRHAFLKDYRVHFIVDRLNYGIVTVYLNDPKHPGVHFDLHYQAKDGTWKSKSISRVQT